MLVVALLFRSPQEVWQQRTQGRLTRDFRVGGTGVCLPIYSGQQPAAAALSNHFSPELFPYSTNFKF